MSCPPDFLPLGEEDLDALAALAESIVDFPWSRGQFADSLAAGHALFGYKAAGSLLGFAVTMQVLDEVELLDIGVARSHQGQGLGRALLQQAMSAAMAKGAQRMLLEVRASNAPAIGLYENLGFRQMGRRRDYYPATTGREDALIYDKELAWA